MATITVYKNRAATFRHTYKDSAGTAVSITGLIITGALKKNRGDSAAKIEFTTEGASANIDIIESGETNTGVYDVTFAAADTATLQPGTYLLGYSYQATEPDDKTFFGEVQVFVEAPIDE
jgi:hypothetical protein